MFALLFSAATLLIGGFNTPSGTLVVDLQVPITKGWQVVQEAPWSLDIKDLDGIQVDTREFKPGLPGFVLESANKTDTARFVYKLTAFLCAPDRSYCRREIFSGIARVRVGSRGQLP